jgi:5-methylcytosine-specific restriction protein A
MPTRPPTHQQLARQPRKPWFREDKRTTTERGYGYDWQQLRAQHIAEHPLCVECEREGRVTAATQIDHVIPHKGDDSLRLDPRNLQSLCDNHHSAKTIAERAK